MELGDSIEFSLIVFIGIGGPAPLLKQRHFPAVIERNKNGLRLYVGFAETDDDTLKRSIAGQARIIAMGLFPVGLIGDHTRIVVVERGKCNHVSE